MSEKRRLSGFAYCRKTQTLKETVNAAQAKLINPMEPLVPENIVEKVIPKMA